MQTDLSPSDARNLAKIKRANEMNLRGLLDRKAAQGPARSSKARSISRRQLRAMFSDSLILSSSEFFSD